ncbi:hypothetical protein VIBNISFn118_350014 [Vibrio nigripulchritudo SFn118]|nr:hypothetical protein VIBNISFn118_350014 [Vibrio nigripulchritudo SFn118]
MVLRLQSLIESSTNVSLSKKAARFQAKDRPGGLFLYALNESRSSELDFLGVTNLTDSFPICSAEGVP